MGAVPHGPVGPEPHEPFAPHVDDLTGVAEHGVGGGIVPEEKNLEEDPDEYLED